LGEGLLTSRGEKHVRQRRATAPAFHREQIGRYTKTMVECADLAMTTWPEGEAFDVHAEMMRLTLAIVGRTLFSSELEKNAELQNGLNTLVRMSPMALVPFIETLEKLPIPSMRRINKALTQVDSTVYRLIREHKNGDQDDMLSLLLRTYDDAVCERELRDECVAMIFAGYETTSNALAWTWYLLSEHPEVEEALHQEIESVLGDRLPTVEDLPRLRRVEMVLSESMRLFPPAWAVGRRAMERAVIAGFEIPKGSLLIVSQWLLHRDERYFRNASRFDPTRWSSEAQQSRPFYAYFPFGAGPRQCIGEGFAWTEALLLIAGIAQRWQLRLVEGHPVEPQAVVTLRPKYGMKMVAERRAPAQARTGTARA
jgi:cytochrome P450